MACNNGLLSASNGLLRGIVASDFGLLGFPRGLYQAYAWLRSKICTIKSRSMLTPSAVSSTIA